MENKSAVRDIYKRRRDSLDEKRHRENSENIAKHLFATEIFQSAEILAAYLSIGKEVATKLIIEEAWNQKKQVYVPVINKDGVMNFALYSANTILTDNFYGIPEPVNPTATDFIDVRSLQLVLVPVLAFDRNGTRLGMGGGYYDRYFSFLNDPLLRKSPFLMALAHDCQQDQKLPSDAWDIEMHAVTTEKETISFRI